MSVSESRGVLKNEGFEVRVIGMSDSIVEQFPKPGASLSKGSTVIIYCEGAQTNAVIVPDLVGKDISTVKKELSDLGLNLEIVGSTHNNMQNAPASKQEPVAGSEVMPAATIRVEFTHLEVD